MHVFCVMEEVAIDYDDEEVVIVLGRLKVLPKAYVSATK